MKHITDTQITAIMAETQRTGGATFEGFEVIHHRSGYQVATTNNTATAADIESIRAALELTGGNGGTWIDPASGALYIDSSHRVNSLTLAVYEAVQYEQRAIWDHSRTKEIRIAE